MIFQRENAMRMLTHKSVGVVDLAGSRDPLSVMGRVLGPAETAPMDRRRFLSLMAAVGGLGAAGTTIWDTALPKRTTEIQARPHRHSEEGTEDLNTLKRVASGLYGPSQMMQQRHTDLFHRTYTIQYEEEHESCTTTCTTDSDGNSDCDTDCTTYYTTEHQNGDLWIDAHMGSLNSGYLNRLVQRYAGIVGLVDRILSPGLFEIAGEIEGVNLDYMSAGEFANHFGFEWGEGRVSTGKQVAMATGIGALGLSGFLFYKRIWDGLIDLFDRSTSYGTYQYRSRKRPSVPLFSDTGDGGVVRNYLQAKEETEATRRSFFQMLLGGLTLGLTLRSKKKYEARSATIRGDAENKMRQSIVKNNKWDKEKLFENTFDIHAAGLVAEAKSLVGHLRALQFNEVHYAVRRGILDLEAAARKARDDIEGEVDKEDAKIVRIDDRLDETQIRDYISKAHEAALELEQKIAILEKLFADGVPESIRPALRAYAITEDAKKAVTEQNSRHMWGLARDLGLIYGGATALMALSEIDAAHDAVTNNLVHGAFDWWDRQKMTAWGVVTGMKRNYSAHQMSQIFDSGEFDAMAMDQVSDLKKMARDYVEMGAVSEYRDPLLSGYFSGQNGTAKSGVRTLREQLDEINPDDVIKVYVEKAFVYFAREQLGLRGLKRDVLVSSDGGRRIVKNPPFAEFKNKVEELMQNAGSGFIFDLIDAGVIEDQKPGEDWQDAENSELPGYINYWADRIAGSVAGSANMNVALKILPDSWFDRGNQTHERVSRQDVLEAFAAYAATQSDEYNQFKKDCGRARGQDVAISEEEYQLRFLFKQIKNAVEAHRFWEILCDHSPKLRAALSEMD